MTGRYEIEAKLGEGGMADVYRARDTEIGRTVALKVLKPEYASNPDFSARFLREARAAGALSHANIATIYDYGREDEQPYIAMELVEGQPLDERLAANGRMPYERVLDLARQIASALEYAHQAGVVHRDIKPSNILITSDGRTAKLLDFGVARVMETEGAALARTQIGQTVGTPRYMSPEQTLGLPVDGRSDLFSLGVVLYEMVTGKPAFPGQGLATVAIQIAKEKVEPIGRAAADCPSGLKFIIDKLLAKKPEQRYSDAAALLTALERELQAVKEPQSSRRGLSLRVKLPLALVAVTALALAAIFQATFDRQERTLEQMARVSGNSIAAFVTGNAAVVAADNAGRAPDEQDWTSLQAFVATAVEQDDVRDIVVTDGGGTIRAAGDPVLVGSDHASWTSRRAGGRDGLHFVRPIEYAGAEFGEVDIVLSRAPLDAAAATSRRNLAVLAGLIMLVVLAVGYLSGSLVSRPLRRLRAALEDAAESGFALRISHKRRDEFGETFDAFNRAAAEAETLIDGAHEQPAESVVATRVAA